MTVLYEVGDNLYVNLTNKCSNNCDFCTRNNCNGYGDANDLWLHGHEPTVEEVKVLFDQRDMSRYHEVVFCGFGEPTERVDDVAELARYVKEKYGKVTRINTNGQSDLINGRPTAHLFAGVMDTVNVSLNTCSADKYDAECHSIFGKDAFEALIRYAVDCSKYVGKVVFSVVDVIPPEDIEQCRRIAEENGIGFRVRKYIDNGERTQQ
ncbi:MAG TPA: radical SAM protein [Candidatus Onthovicinus excrementipullorum]|nr:radical SAM protein [Candidatus Onthovicinus excrementipullorum]